MIPLIVPAILTNSFDEFANQVKRTSPFFSSIQIDVLDGTFLPNKTFSERAELNNVNSEAYFELHLMVKDPVAEIAKWSEIDSVTSAVFHIEAGVNAEECIQVIKQKNWKVGVALNPETPIEKIMPYADLVDEVLFMTVHPGQQGAQFIPEVLEKVKEFKKLYPQVTCSADGGINKDTVKLCQEAGLDKLYIGSAITTSDDVESAHQELINELDD